MNLGGRLWAEFVCLLLWIHYRVHDAEGFGRERECMKTKAVIFDMDGVLIDTEKHLIRYWCQAGQEAGYPFER